jgi:hypothetical protein
MLTLLPKGVPTKKINLFSYFIFFYRKNIFANSIKNTGGATLAANISANFNKNLKRPAEILRGLGENSFMKKPEV